MNFPPSFPSDYYANQFHVFAEWNPSSQLIDLRLIHYSGLGGRNLKVAEPVVLKERDEQRFIEPTLQMNTATAQSLMDALWTCGLRPTEGTGSAGALAATQKHLDDMRALVFRSPHLTKEPVVK